MPPSVLPRYTFKKGHVVDIVLGAFRISEMESVYKLSKIRLKLGLVKANVFNGIGERGYAVCSHVAYKLIELFVGAGRSVCKVLCREFVFRDSDGRDHRAGYL